MQGPMAVGKGQPQTREAGECDVWQVWKTVWQLLKTLRVKSPLDPTGPLEAIYSRV